MAMVLNSKEFALYHRKLAERFRPAVLRGVNSGAARAVSYLVERTRAAPPANPSGIGSGGAVDTGAFIRSWRAVPMPDGASLVNTSGYSPIIEDGRRARSKFPPRAALIAWIRRKLSPSPRPRKTSSNKRDSFDDRVKERAREAKESKRKRRYSMSEAERLYFPIARAIARRGLKGRKILNADEARTWILELVRREVAAELNREMGRRP